MGKLSFGLVGRNNLYVKDILNVNNHFMSADELNMVWLQTLLSVLQLRQALPYKWRQY